MPTEVFYMSADEFRTSYRKDDGTWMAERMADALARSRYQDPPTPDDIRQEAADLAGWYWWPCFPGCMPDSDASGPYATEDKAIEAAREGDE